jgi:hypothetical protein
MSLFDSASLCVTPNAYKEDKLYSIKPTDGSGDLVVTRATTATRVNSAGLVEIVPYNLVTYSEQFDNAAWSKISVGSASVPVVTANSTTAPNGTLTADKIVFNAPASGDISIIKQNISLTGTANGSIYIKAFSNSDIGKIIGFRFNADTYALITLTDSWQRFSVSQVALESFDIQLRPSVGTSSGSVSVYVWGAQLVTGTSAKEYFPTTDRLNVPRIDYTNGSCPSILVEPQRTNLITYSEDFTNVSWVKADTNVTSNAIVAPDGNTTADYLIPNTTYTLHTASKFSLATAGNNTFSIFAKQGGYKNIFVWFDVHSGGIGINLDTLNVFRNENLVSYKVTPYSNGWVNISITANILVTSNPTIYICDNSATPSAFFSGNGTSGVYFWGGQLEAASYPTSYIPTVASSVTRNADFISKTGISSLINSQEGVLFLNSSALENNTTARFIELNDNTGGISNNIYFRYEPFSNVIAYTVFSGGALQCNISYSLSSQKDYNKMAFVWALNRFEIWVNGAKVVEDTSGVVPVSSSIDKLMFSQRNGTENYEGNLKTLAIWKTALTNAELATLTTI